MPTASAFNAIFFENIVLTFLCVSVDRGALKQYTKQSEHTAFSVIWINDSIMNKNPKTWKIALQTTKANKFIFVEHQEVLKNRVGLKPSKGIESEFSLKILCVDVKFNTVFC